MPPGKAPSPHDCSVNPLYVFLSLHLSASHSSLSLFDFTVYCVVKRGQRTAYLVQRCLQSVGLRWKRWRSWRTQPTSNSQSEQAFVEARLITLPSFTESVCFFNSSERSRQFLAKLWPTVSVKIKSSQEFRSRKPKRQQRNLSVYYFKKQQQNRKYNSIMRNSFMHRHRQGESVCVHKHTLFSTAQCRTATLCFGTTQDIPAGFYQPKFQDTTSLSHR